jgi:thiamine biosynthesis protein ThiS
MIEIKANGKPFEIEDNTLLVDFIASIDLAIERVVVEYNKEALTQSEAKQQVLKNGDSLEIIRIVAGG